MKLTFLFVFVLNICLSAQVVYVPLWNDVYDFLDRQSLKQNISLDDEVKPYSRKYVASLLEKLISEKNKLNSIEQKELEFYRQEFAYELNEINNERWYLFSYSDTVFTVKLSPLAGYGLSTTGNNSGSQRWIGLSTFGSYSDWFGASFDIRDKGEFGDNVDKEKQFTPQTGAWTKSVENGIEYSDVKGSITFDWGWGNAGLLKDYFTWGHGSFGQLIFSEKPPSYPHIRFTLKPVEWLRFYYFHGWLNSLVIDSSGIIIEYPGTISEREKKSYLNKYVAANLLTLSPLNWLDISLGNSFVYSGDLRAEMFIPFMFFKFLDHNTGQGSVNDGNGTLYFDLKLLYPETYQFYSTVFVDVTEIRNVLEEDFSNTWVGYTFGAKKVDLFFPNLDIAIEYTRVNPWVYEHKLQSTNYKHINFVLGHWLGQNADQIKVQFNYRLFRGLSFKIYFEWLRKGGMEEIYYAYAGKDEKELDFLYSPLREDKTVGFLFRLEYLHDLILEGQYQYSEITDEDAYRTPSFMLGNNHSFGISLFYGI